MSLDEYEGFDENTTWNNTYSRSKLKVFKILQDSTFKGFAIDNELVFSMYNFKKKLKDRLYFHQLERKIFSYNVHIGFWEEYDFLYSTFDWKIKQLVEGGFFAHWIDRYLSHPSLQPPEQEPDDDKVVLTMDHLSVGLTIWLGMLLIASAVFIGELVRSCKLLTRNFFSNDFKEASKIASRLDSHNGGVNFFFVI